MDDGSRIILHLVEPPPKASPAVCFDQPSSAGPGQAKAFLTALTESRNEFLSSTEAISAEADPKVEEAAAAYLALLLGLVNNYGQGPALDQETGLGLQQHKACFAQ